MSLELSPLLVEVQTVGDAHRTLTLAFSAARKGDMRLAVSRAVTAIVQASVAAKCGQAGASVLQTADGIIQKARDLVHGIVLEKLEV